MFICKRIPGVISVFLQEWRKKKAQNVTTVADKSKLYLLMLEMLGKVGGIKGNAVILPI